MEREVEVIETFGDVRRLILQTIMQVRDGGLDVQQGMCIAANMKVLNDNIQCEINAAKLSMLASERGSNFGKIVGMGRRLIGSNTEQS